MNLFFKSWLPVLLWGFLIFYLSSIPNLKSSFEADFILRKFAHIFEYFILAVLVFNAWLKTFKRQIDFKKIAFYVFIIASFYAISDEFHQSFVFGRHGDIKDVFMDSIGVLCGVIIFYFGKKK
ncbi:MAG: VanZ family protein [Patescibacteria group bacterium]